MKRLKKAGIVISLVALMTAAVTTNASAATVSDGIKAEITVSSQDSDKANIEAVVKNANYYEIDGINCKLSVSDNAELSGEDVKTDISLASEQTESLKAEISLKTGGETQPSENPTQAPTKKPENPTQPTTQPKTATTITNAETTGKSAIKTGEENNIMPIVALCVAAFAVAIGVAFKKKNRRMMSLMLCLCLALSVGAVGVVGVNAAEGNSIKVITDEAVVTINGTDVTVTFTVEYPEQPEIHDNTLEDLKALNGNSLDITYNDAGEITFLSGKYTDYKVINAETAMSSLQAVESILNAKENDIRLIPINVKTADNGDKYFTFQQIVGAVVLQNAFITVGADKDGNTLCISSSIQPKAGVKDLEENMLTAEQAFEKALSAAEETVGCTLEKADKEPELDYMMYSKLGTSNLCWVVYFKHLTPTEQDPEKSKYVKVYIDASSGELENLLYLSSLEDYRTSEDVYDNDVYFKGVTTEIKTFTNYLGNKVELPVAKTDSGTYYFIDTERKMVCADTSKVEPIEYRQMIPYEFASPEEVSPIFVSVFDNMRRIYDKYAEKGIRSLNGNGLPIMICLGYQQYGQEIENACFAGDYFGWGVFMFSKFPISTGLDVAAHEFTHGIKGNITGIVAYQNTTGAIEESYADILGNLTEMLIDPENSDTEQWLMGESTGKAIRSMSDPHAYAQPEYVGDAYYLMECDTPGELNDRGGVHINNSVLSKICYEMYKSGISMEEDYDIWLNTFLVLNPNASFDDVLGYVKYSAVRSGKEQYLDIIQQLFENGKAVNAQTDSWEGYPVPEGYAKIKLVAHDFPEGVDWGAAVINGTKQGLIYKDKTETYSTILDKANVILLIRYKDDPNAAPNAFFCLPMNQEGYNLKIDKDEVVVEFSYNDLVSTKKN